MACGCNKSTPVSPTGEPLPTIFDHQALVPEAVPGCSEDLSTCQATPVQPVCINPNNEQSINSGGRDLESSWLDASCENEGVILLGRKDRKLSRFTGSGFLQLLNGKASVVQALKIQVSSLWHKWWKPGSYPVLGDPNPFPYLVIGDKTGTLHGIKGVEGEDSIPVYDDSAKQFNILPVSQVPNCVRGLLPKLNAIELTGYAPIPSNANPALPNVRCQSRLGGNGVVVVTEQPTIPSDCLCEGCDPVEDVAAVTSTVAFPEAEEGKFALGVIDGVTAFHPVADLAEDIIDDLEAQINAEESARISADNALTTSVGNEATTRAFGDTTLQANIDAEAVLRQTGDDNVETVLRAYYDPLTGTTNPSANAPNRGKLYINTSTLTAWIAVATGTGAADWKQISN